MHAPSTRSKEQCGCAQQKTSESKTWLLRSLILHSIQFKVLMDLELHLLGNHAQQNRLEGYGRGIFLKIALDYSYVALLVAVTGSRS